MLVDRAPCPGVPCPPPPPSAPAAPALAAPAGRLGPPAASPPPAARRVAPGFLVPPLLGPAASHGSAMLGGCKGSWSRWAGPGFVLASRRRPVLLRSPVTPGGRVFGVPQACGSCCPFRAVAGRRGFHARSYKVSAGPAASHSLFTGQRRWLWVVWEGAARFAYPRRASVVAWLAGSFPGWVFS